MGISTWGFFAAASKHSEQHLAVTDVGGAGVVVVGRDIILLLLAKIHPELKTISSSTQRCNALISLTQQHLNRQTQRWA